MSDTQLYDDLVDALYAIFGSHAGFRVTHAKGVVALGTFIASPAAKSVTRAAHLQGGRVPVTLRFSNFSGVPSTADGDASASPRGIALQFMLPDGRYTDLIAHSHDGFPVGTPEAFLGFLHALAATEANPPDPLPLETFLAHHPQAKRYLEAPKPAPRSYLSQSYFGINTFRFLGASGEIVHGRYRVDPMTEEATLSEAEGLAMQADFLSEELTTRLRTGPARLRLVLQCAAPGDKLDDGSVSWPRNGPDARPEIELGIISVEMVETDALRQRTLQQNLAFNPGELTDGIEASDDPMIAARSKIYQRAVQRRREAEK